MPQKRKLEDAQVGDTIGPARYKLTEEMADFAASNLGWKDFRAPSSPTSIAPSCVTDNDYALAWIPHYTTGEAIHAKAEHHYINPPIIGKELVITGRVSDRYNKRGKDFVVFETATKDEDGREIVRSKNTILISF